MFMFTLKMSATLRSWHRICRASVEPNLLSISHHDHTLLMLTELCWSKQGSTRKPRTQNWWRPHVAFSWWWPSNRDRREVERGAVQFVRASESTCRSPFLGLAWERHWTCMLSVLRFFFCRVVGPRKGAVKKTYNEKVKTPN